MRKKTILAVHPSANGYTFFSNVIKEPYVRKINVPYETESRSSSVAIPTLGNHCRHGISRRTRMPITITVSIPNKNPENYLKPLDVVWVKKNSEQ